MPGPPPSPERDLSPADWLTRSLDSLGPRVDELVPAGFEAHVRILHRPDQGLPDPDEASTWAEMARLRGTTVHPSAAWRLVAGWDQVPRGPGGDPSREAEPLEGSLDRLTLPRLITRLRDHTTTPESCWLALWHGFGHSPAAWSEAPTVALPGRKYWLFHAPLDAVPELSVDFAVAGTEERSTQPGGLHLLLLGRRRTPTVEDQIEVARWMREGGAVQSPSLWWPDDRAWVVASEIDFDSTIVAGPAALADELLADPEIECLRVEAGTSLTLDDDVVNRA